MKKLIPVIALAVVSLVFLSYGLVNASKVKELEQKLADYEAAYNSVVSENEEYKENIDKLENRLSLIQNALTR